jgi:hypothetical protein
MRVRGLEGASLNPKHLPARSRFGEGRRNSKSETNPKYKIRNG